MLPCVHVGHSYQRRSLVAEDSLFPSTPFGDSPIRTPELDEFRCFFLLACHSWSKTLRSQGAEGHNRDTLLPSLFSSSFLRARFGWHLRMFLISRLLSHFRKKAVLCFRVPVLTSEKFAPPRLFRVHDRRNTSRSPWSSLCSTGMTSLQQSNVPTNT